MTQPDDTGDATSSAADAHQRVADLVEGALDQASDAPPPADDGGTTDARAPDKQAKPKGQKRATSPKAGDSDAPRQRAPAQRDNLLSVCQTVDLWHAPDGTEYATFAVKAHRENWPIRSRRFKSWLAGRAYAELGIAPGGQALEDSLRILEARALHEGQERIPIKRTAGRDGKIIIDTGQPDWSVIEVACGGWRTVEHHNWPIVRSNSTCALPIPEAGESIDRLRQFLNTTEEADFKMVVGWLVMALGGEGEFPILSISGEQGTGKSTFTTLLRKLVDPAPIDHRSIPKDIRDLAIAAYNSHVISFDNVSHIEIDMADAMCRTASGSGFATRLLHSDKEENVINIHNPIILNGIPSLTERGDLAERMATVRLRVIPENERQTKRKLGPAFEKEAPYIMGALLDGLCSGLRNVESVELPSLPRLADFVIWVEACAPGLGWAQGDFAALYANNRANAADSAFEADAVAVAIATMMQARARVTWTGTPTELLAELALHTSEAARHARAWPVTAQGLGNRMDRAAPLLRRRGVHFEKRHSGQRYYSIWCDPTE